MLSLLFAGVILYWMYRDFDFSEIGEVMTDEMDWTWMILSFPFAIFAMLFRAWRWNQTLEPVGEKSRTSVRNNSILFSYFISLFIPRIGEFARCGILTKYDKVSFAKAIGTVVTERLIDSILVLLMTGIIFLLQINVFASFFDKTGTNIDGIFNRFTPAGWLVTIICGLAAIGLVVFICKKMTVHKKFKDALHSTFEGITSLKGVKNLPLFILLSVGIWVMYFIHYYICFFCFDFTADLGIMCGLVTFIVGSIAVIVPTPNGAGPWHFAVKTMLVLYGVAETDALYFVLIVHSVQTMLVVLAGLYSVVSLFFTKTIKKENVIQ